MRKRWMKLIFIAPLAILGILLFIVHRRRAGDAAVELAAAAAFRLAADHFLAGARDSGAVPDPLRRIWAPWFRPLQFPPSHGARMRERCGNMTPEERERFRQGMRERWGFGPSTSESKG